MVTSVWLSAAVEKVSLFLQGIVVLASISFVITPPKVSIPKVNGVTSSNTMSPTPASLFNTAPGQRSNVEQYDVAHTSLFVQYGTLYGSTYGYYLIGVHTLGRNFTEEVLN